MKMDANIVTIKKNNRKRLNLKRDYQLYLLIFLPMIYFIIFRYIPMYGVTIAFKDYNLFMGIFKSEWVGFDVFREIFGFRDFFRALKNTLVLNFLDLLFMFPAPILVALCLNEIRNIRFRKVSQTILYFPHFISWVVIGSMAYQIFALNNGVINNILKNVGIGPIPFLTENWYWIATYVITGIWQSAGWDAIIYIAAMTGIDPCLYEAADVDGAGRLKKIIMITLPSIKSTIITLLIMRIGQLMSMGFERPYVMGNALVTEVSDVISTYVYRLGLQGGKFSQSAAVGLFQSLVGLAMIITSNCVAKKFGEDGIW